MSAHAINQNSIHLGRGSTAEVELAFTGSAEWYQRYINWHEDDGGEGCLVAMHSFSAPWDMWEMQPRGSEVVLCITGAMTPHQESPDGTVTSTGLTPGHYAIKPPGVRHTADVDSEATALFITAGLGAEHRPR